MIQSVVRHVVCNIAAQSKWKNTNNENNQKEMQKQKCETENERKKTFTFALTCGTKTEIAANIFICAFSTLFFFFGFNLSIRLPFSTSIFIRLLNSCSNFNWMFWFRCEKRKAKVFLLIPTPFVASLCFVLFWHWFQLHYHDEYLSNIDADAEATRK